MRHRLRVVSWAGAMSPPSALAWRQPSGPGHDPYTHEVSDHAKVCMASMARAQGYHAEDVTEPSEIIPALRRALEANAKRQPAFLEVICSQHPVYGGWLRDAAVGH